MNFCKKCGRPLMDEMNFCSKCGERVEKNSFKEDKINDKLTEEIIKEKDEIDVKLESNVDNMKKNKKFFLNKKAMLGLSVLVIVVIGAFFILNNLSGTLKEKNQYEAGTRKYTKSEITLSIPKYFEEGKSKNKDVKCYFADDSKYPVLAITDAETSVTETYIADLNDSFAEQWGIENGKTTKYKKVSKNGLIYYQSRMNGKFSGVKTKAMLLVIPNYQNDDGLVLIYNQYDGLEYNYKNDILEIVQNAKLNKKKQSTNTQTKENTSDNGNVSETISQKNAKIKAKEYLSSSAFSRQGLIDQLIYEQFSESDATYAVDNISADWAAEARECARNYLSSMGFSRQGLIEQLMYDDFSEEDATNGVDSVSADWNEQAYKVAQNYLKSSGYSHGGLVEQLVYEGFTQEQAEYGVSKTGL